MTQYILKHCMSQHAVEVNLDRTTRTLYESMTQRAVYLKLHRTARTLYDTSRSRSEPGQNTQNIVWHSSAQYIWTCTKHQEHCVTVTQLDQVTARIIFGIEKNLQNSVWHSAQYIWHWTEHPEHPEHQVTWHAEKVRTFTRVSGVYKQKNVTQHACRGKQNRSLPDIEVYPKRCFIQEKCFITIDVRLDQKILLETLGVIRKLDYKKRRIYQHVVALET